MCLWYVFHINYVYDHYVIVFKFILGCMMYYDVIVVCEYVFIFFRHLGLLAHRLTKRLSGSGTTKWHRNVPCWYFRNLPCYSLQITLKLPNWESDKNEVCLNISTICDVLSWFIIIFLIFSHQKMDRTGDFSSSICRRTTGCIPEPVPELEELSWTWPSQPLKDFFTAGKGPRTKWRLQWENMGRSSIYGI